MTTSEPENAGHETTQLIHFLESHRGLRISLYGLATLATFYALYSARSLLMPIVVALFFALLLSPLVQWLKERHVPRALSSVLLLGLLLGPFVLLSIKLAEPAQKWVEMLPELTSQVTEGLTDISKTLSPDVPPPTAEESRPERGFSFSRFFHGEGPQTEPIEPPVESALVEGVKKSGVEIILTVLGAAPFIVAQCAVWLVLVLFLLIYGPGLYDNAINLLPMIRDKRRATLLVGRLRQQLSRYILAVTIINASLGIATGSVLLLFGVEDALLWGALVGLINYAPYVGPFISICVLSIVGITQYGLNLYALMPAAIFFSIDLIESQFITPSILGQHMRMNPLILVLWLLVWGSLWGPVGVLIAVPLLVCLKLVLAQLEEQEFWVELIETPS